MKKAYLLAYSDSKVTRAQITEFLNKSSLISTWRYDMPNSYYLISENSANEISTAMREQIAPFRHLLVEITENHYGWLPSDSWFLIKNKELKSK